MSTKLDITQTKTFSAKGCTYEDGVFSCDGEPIDFNRFLGYFEGAFDMTIKEQSKDSPEAEG